MTDVSSSTPTGPLRGRMRRVMCRILVGVGVAPHHTDRALHLARELLTLMKRAVRGQFASYPTSRARAQHFLDQGTAMAVACRDNGLRSLAFWMLCRLSVIAPHHINTTVELLVFHLFVHGNLKAAEAVIHSLTEEQRSEPRLALLSSDYFSRVGKLSECARSFMACSTVDFGAADFFVELQKKHALTVCLQAPDVLRELFGIENNQEIAELIVREGIISFFHGIRDPNAMFARLHEIAMVNTRHIPKVKELACVAFEDIALCSDVEIIGMALHFLVCIHAHASLERVIPSLIQNRPDVWQNPMACKAMANYLPLCKRDRIAEDLWQILAGHPWKIDGWRYDKAAIQAVELTARDWALREPDVTGSPPLRLKPPAWLLPAPQNGKKVFFVGLFGQVRYEGLSMRDLRAYLMSIMEPFCAKHGLELRWAASVWNSIGERQLLITDGIGFAFQRLPLSLVDLCERYAVGNMAAFGHFLPATLQRLLQAPASRSFSQEDLEKLFGSLSCADVADEGAFAKEFEKYFPSSNRDWINQCRMWDRIRSLGSLFTQWESTTGEAVVGSFITRPDIIFQEGTWAEALEDVVSGQSVGRIYCDEDQVASFVEGVGDRYFISGREDFPRLSSVWEAIADVAPTLGDQGRAFTKRFNAHTLAQSYLFQHGADIAQFSGDAIKYELYRGRTTIDYLRNDLTADAHAVTDSQFRQELLRLL